MGQDLDEKFEKEWPEFFRDCYCGFWLPERWEDIVWRLCGQIAWELNQVAKLPLETVKVAQVKEKFGGLRFYFDWTYEASYSRSTYVQDKKAHESHIRISAFVQMVESISAGIK